MVDSKAEALAEEVLSALELDTFPIDPLKIAADEKIELAPSSNFGREFHGCLQYHWPQGKFILCYPVDAAGVLSPRGRFSVAHELGHFYNLNDRTFLIENACNEALGGFICDDEMEFAANSFAGALLIPRSAVLPMITGSGLMELSALKKISVCFNTSIQCAALRYAKLTTRSCSIIISRNGRRRFQVDSDQALKSGARRVRMIPPDSLVAKRGPHLSYPVGRDTLSTTWFGDDSRSFRMREEAIGVDVPGHSLTMLSWDS
jgi:hypothetical protein